MIAASRPACDVVGLGLNAMDYICVVPEFPERHSKLGIKEVRLLPGGQVATALVVCRRFGLTSRYIGSVGSDELGRAQRTSLEAAGVHLEYLRVVDGAASQMAVILVEEGIGERTILWHRDVQLTYPAEIVSPQMLVGARLLHLDGRDAAAALAIARLAREAGVPMCIDIDQIYDESTHELLALVDHLIAAEDFAARVTGEADTEKAVRLLAARYGNPVVGITIGPRGAVFLSQGAILHSPGFEVSAVDTTGAGDVFHGAYIFGLLQGWDLDRRARFANASAALKCTQFGARAGIPTLQELERFLTTARPSPSGPSGRKVREAPGEGR